MDFRRTMRHLVIYTACIVCQAGVARTTIRTGDVPRGISLAQSSENPTLQRECGAILEVRIRTVKFLTADISTH